MSIKTGRWSATVEGDFVVFLIGMRFNKPWKVRTSVPIFVSMPRMIRWLEKRPQEGLLHWELVWRTPLEPTVIQYWRSFEDLARFARDADAPHLERWKRFNQQVRDSGDVGIWHETYRVRAGESESIFGNMPPRGLAVAGDLNPTGSTTARTRIGAESGDIPPIAPY